jgi:hypothetical protein
VFGASNGDSAALLLNPNQPEIILTARQHKNPPIGSGGATGVTFVSRLVPPWTLLALTDGVWKYVGWEAIGKVAKENRGGGILQALQALARLPSGGFQDDFTLVVFENEGT